MESIRSSSLSAIVTILATSWLSGCSSSSSAPTSPTGPTAPTVPGAPAPTAPATVDQRLDTAVGSCTGSFNISTGTGRSFGQAQTFTVGRTGTLTGADLAVYYEPAPAAADTLHIQVRTTAGAPTIGMPGFGMVPTAAVLTNGLLVVPPARPTNLNADLGSPQGLRLQHVDFRPEISVAIGQRLALVIFDEGKGTALLPWAFNGQNLSGNSVSCATYAGGQAFLADTPEGPMWSTAPAFGTRLNFYFRTYVR